MSDSEESEEIEIDEELRSRRSGDELMTAAMTSANLASHWFNRHEPRECALHNLNGEYLRVHIPEYDDYVAAKGRKALFPPNTPAYVSYSGAWAPVYHVDTTLYVPRLGVNNPKYADVYGLLSRSPPPTWMQAMRSYAGIHASQLNVDARIMPWYRRQGWFRPLPVRSRKELTTGDRPKPFYRDACRQMYSRAGEQIRMRSEVAEAAAKASAKSLDLMFFEKPQRYPSRFYAPAPLPCPPEELFPLGQAHHFPPPIQEAKTSSPDFATHWPFWISTREYLRLAYNVQCAVPLSQLTSCEKDELMTAVCRFLHGRLLAEPGGRHQYSELAVATRRELREAFSIDYLPALPRASFYTVFRRMGRLIEKYSMAFRPSRSFSFTSSDSEDKHNDLQFPKPPAVTFLAGEAESYDLYTGRYKPISSDHALAKFWRERTSLFVISKSNLRKQLRGQREADGTASEGAVANGEFVSGDNAREQERGPVDSLRPVDPTG